MRRQLQGIALILVSILLTQCFGGEWFWEWFWGREFRWCVVFALVGIIGLVMTFLPEKKQ